MQFRRIGVLHGPNRWARVPVLEVELERPPPGSAMLHPGLYYQENLPLPDLSGDVPEVLGRMALHLQVLAGSPVAFVHTQTTEQQDVCRVIVEYEEEALGRACLDAARDLCLAVLNDQPFDLSARLAPLRELAYDIRLGPSTAAIVRAARSRGIPTQRLNTGSLVQLGHGARQHRILTAETDRTSAIAEAIAQDKQLTRSLLRSVGVPVPEGRPVVRAEEAWEAAEELGVPVVVKPQYGNHGRGVATNLSTRAQVMRAYEAAREEGDSILVEQFIPGVDFRLLVVGDRLVAAALREPAQVKGDGRSTVTQLIDEVNRDPRRSEGHATVLSRIKLDPVALAVLAEQGHSPDSVPAMGERVLIRRNGNLSTGGTATDVTDVVHPEVRARAVDAARAVGLDIAGVDVVALDIAQPLEAQRGAVVEVNAGPGLRMHLEPSAGKPRPVGEAIVSMLFPEGQTGRIPLVAVIGANDKTTTRLIDHLLRRHGLFVGMTCTDGFYLNGRQTETRDCTGPRSARALLMNPLVEAAVLEMTRDSIVREGLGIDCYDVAVITNIETLDDRDCIERIVVEAVSPTGTAVLNAADPHITALAKHCPGRVAYFAERDDNPSVKAHVATGGRAVFVREGKVVLAEGRREEMLLALEQMPLTHGDEANFPVRDVLAATATAWALLLPAGILRSGLETFKGDSYR